MSLMLAQPRIDVESPVVATASFDPPVVRPGETSIYRLSLNALEQSIDWANHIDSTPKLDFRLGGHGQILAMAGGSFQPRTSFDFHVKPATSGTLTVPEFKITVYGKAVTVPGAQLQVVTDPITPAGPLQQLTLQVPTTNLFAGQSLRVNIMFPGTPAVVMQGQAPIQLTGEGFLVDQSTFRARMEMKPVGPGLSRGPNLIYEVTLTPLASGKLSVLAQSFAINRFSGQFVVGGPPGTITSPPMQYTLFDSEPLELQVKPLPREGQLPGFTGAVGSYALYGQPELGTNVLQVGEPVRLRVRVRGDAYSNIARLVPPPAPKVRDWQVLAAPDESASPQIIQAQGFIVFNYVLIPLTTQTRATPAIPFSCFEPELGLYADLSIPGIPVEVHPGAVPADISAVLQANALGTPAEKELSLSGVAPGPGISVASLVPLQRQVWYPLLQLLPAGAFIGLWGWDRRRRFLEQNPDIVVRRRARRALRRERRRLRKAAHAQDAAGFALSAVKALRVACAPYYPAEAQALVGADVIATLPDEQRLGAGGELVRRFFAITDARQFGKEPQEVGELLGLEVPLEQVLQQLEEKL